MLAVDVGIGHQHDLVVPRLRDVEVFADARAERGDHRLDLGVAERTVEARLLDIQDLAAQRQDRLPLRVATRHGRAAGGVALDEEDLRDRRVLARAVLELLGHRGRLEHALATGGLAGLPCGEARGRGIHRLHDDALGLHGVAVEPVGELVADDLLHERLRLGVAELGLRLSLELRLRQLHGDDGGETLADVIAGEVVVLLLEKALLARVLVDVRRHRGAEALFVRAALVRVDRVREGEDVLGVARRPLHGELERDVPHGVLGLDLDDLVVDDIGLADLVEVLDIVDQAALVVEVVVRLTLDRLAVLGVDHVRGRRTQVAQRDAQALVQECGLLEPGAQRVVVEVDRLEDLGVGPEGDDGARLDRLFALGERRLRLAAVRERLAPHEALAPDLDVEAGRQRVDHRRADAVQAARDRVSAAAELAAGVQHRQHDLDRRLGRVGRVRVDRDASAVVDHADAAVGEDRHVDEVVVPGERLVDGVVDDLVHEMVEAALTGRADVHAGALAHRLEAFEHLDGVGPVIVLDLVCGRRVLLGKLFGNAVGGIGRHRFRALPGR